MRRSRLPVLAAAVTLLAGAPALLSALPAQATSSSGGVVYTVNPPHQLAFPAAAAAKSGWPYSPSQCVQQFGLACYTPAELRTAYGFARADTGAGKTIVIVDAYGSPTIAADLATYDAEFGLPAAQLNVIYPQGQPTFNPNSGNEIGWAEETSLDVEQSHALAPAATIDLVVATTNYGSALNNAVGYAVDNHLGDVLSMSYGAPEAAFAGNNDQVTQAHALFTQAASQGMSVFASAGDSGAYEGTGQPSALYPSSDPAVTSVGGTDLFLSNKGNYQSETAWNDAVPSLCPFGCQYGPFGATGGAPSTLFTAPSYQPAGPRTTSDVAFNASVYTATMIYLGFLGGSNNGFYFFGGTSEGSPSWAAITADADAVAGHDLGALTPALYAIAANARSYAADFHDVTVGDNAFNGPGSGYPAQVGYDLPTGLGSPQVANLVSTLAHGG